MTVTILLALAVVAWILTAWSATAVRVFQGFSRRELELFCSKRRRLDRFGEILDDYEEVALAAENLLIVGLVALVLAGGLGLHLVVHSWLLQTAFATGPPVFFLEFFALALVGTIVVSAAQAWIPYALARLWSAPILYHTWFFWVTAHQLLWPLTMGGAAFDALLRRLAGRPRKADDEEEAFEEEIRSIVTEGLYDGVLEADAREMIEGIIELGDETISHIMTPRSNIDAFDIRCSWAEAMRRVVQLGRTRIPLYEDHLDNIVGVLYVKDLLGELSPDREEPPVPISDLLREPWFVPTTKPLDEMLQEFLQTRKHLAIVVDEYRSVAGVVTIEDVLEEIVGEITDESDKDEAELIRRTTDGTVEVAGIAHVDLVNERLGLDLPEPDEFDTIAGLVVRQLGRIPKSGESVEIEGTRFTVLEATRRRIEYLQIKPVATPETSREV